MHTINLQKIDARGNWQHQLANAITSPDELLQELGLEHLAGALPADPDFRLLVPRAFVGKIQKHNVHDPLLRQVLPLSEESASSGMIDPIGDINAMVTPGLLHKYTGRVLLVTTGACAIHCRYCFRRHFPYSDSNPRKHEWQRALAYMHADDGIEEVILSGGDPLVLDNTKLQDLCQALEKIPHIEWLRFHTRLPVVLPTRIDDGLLALLKSLRFRITFVIHANHANELTDAEIDALQQLSAAGVTLLNQSVLLKGVNDCPATLITLSKKLHQAGVLPYYLHMLDPVQGAMHFEVTGKEAVALLNTVRNELPGYLVPRLVREQPGAGSKTAIFTI